MLFALWGKEQRRETLNLLPDWQSYAQFIAPKDLQGLKEGINFFKKCVFFFEKRHSKCHLSENLNTFPNLFSTGWLIQWLQVQVFSGRNSKNS